MIALHHEEGHPHRLHFYHLLRFISESDEAEDHLLRLVISFLNGLTEDSFRRMDADRPIMEFPVFAVLDIEILSDHRFGPINVCLFLLFIRKVKLIDERVVLAQALDSYRVVRRQLGLLNGGSLSLLVHILDNIEVLKLINHLVTK